MSKKIYKIIFVIVFIILLIFSITPQSDAGIMNAYYTQGSNFNIWGSGVQTTFADHGYDTVLRVGSSEYNVRNGYGSGGGITCNTLLTYVSNGNYVKVTHRITNNSGSAQTVGVSTYADIQIDDDDFAPITNLAGDRGFLMTDGRYAFTFIGRNSYAVTDVDSYWFGNYEIRYENRWNNSRSFVYTNSGRRGDSGMAFAWQNRRIEPGQTLEFSALIGMGELNNPPTLTVDSTLKEQYFTFESVGIAGYVNDQDYGDIVSVKYAIDGGNEQTISSGHRPNGSAVRYDVMIPLPDGIKGGIHTLQIWAADDKGNMSVPVTLQINVQDDLLPPTATHALLPSDWTAGDVTIHLIVTDDKSGVKQVQLPNGEYVTDTEIAYTVTENGSYIFVLEDNAGNIANYEVIVSNIDRDGPSYEFSHTPEEWVIDKVTITWNFWDEQSGFKQVELPSGAITTESSGEYVVTQNGDYTFIATDNVGNITTAIKTITNIDKTPPEGILTQDSNEWTAGNVTIHWSMTDTQSGFKQIVLPNSLVSFQAGGDYVVEESGSYTFLAYDNVENEGIYTIEVTNIDKLAPTLEVTPDTTRWTNGDVTLHWKAVDNQSGLREVVLPDSTLSKEAEGDYAATKNGEYTFLAYDNLGNNSMVTYEVTNIDKIPPTLQLEQVGSNICWKMSDTLSGIRELILPSGEKSIDEEGSYPITKNGIYTFIAYDNVGNERRLNLVIGDQEPKQIQVEITKETENMVTDSLTLNWKILDEGNGFSQIVLPDGTYSETKEGSYVATANGDYTFLVYDVCGRVQQITIRVDNIQEKGNTTISLAKTATTEVVDIKKPTITLTVDPEHKNQIHWEAEDTESGIYKVVLPNGQATIDAQGTYTVPRTGMYTFSVVDNQGNTVKQNIHINTEIFLEKSLYKMTFMI